MDEGGGDEHACAEVAGVEEECGGDAEPADSFCDKRECAGCLRRIGLLAKRADEIKLGSRVHGQIRSKSRSNLRSRFFFPLHT